MENPLMIPVRALATRVDKLEASVERRLKITLLGWVREGVVAIYGLVIGLIDTRIRALQAEDATQ